MTGVILGAGLGTRLRPLTDTTPKVMVDIGGKPLLEYHVELLKKYGVDEIWINTHWLAEKIGEYFGDGAKWGVRINYSFEKELLGSAGALKNPESGIEKALRRGRFVVTYGDNLTNYNLGKLIAFHQQRKAIFSLGLFRAEDPWTRGMVETDGQGRVTKMVEKPAREEVTTNLVNAGVYVCEPKVLDEISKEVQDFGRDLIPKLLSGGEKVFAWEDVGAFVEDVGTPERLDSARNRVEKWRDAG